MAFKRNLNDPIQRRKQQFDDLLTGKIKNVKLESVAFHADAIAAEQAALVKKAAPVDKVVTPITSKAKKTKKRGK